MGNFLDVGGLDLIGGLVDSGFGLVNSVMNAEYQSREAAKQREWQEQMWHAQNTYNHPANVAARMKSAGLSTQGLGQHPVAAGSVGSGASASGAPWQLISPLEGLKSIAEYEAIKAGTKKTETEVEKILKEVQYINMAFESGLIDQKTKDVQLKKFQEEYRRYMEAGEMGINEFVDKHNIDVSTYEQAQQYIKNLEADEVYKSALTSLVEHQKNLTDAQASHVQALAEQIKQKTTFDAVKFPAELRSEYLEAKILDAESYIKLSDQLIRKFDDAISSLLDVDIHDLPKVIRGNIHSAIQRVAVGEVSFAEARDAIFNMLNKYARKEYSILLPWRVDGVLYSESGTDIE